MILCLGVSLFVLILCNFLGFLDLDVCFFLQVREIFSHHFFFINLKIVYLLIGYSGPGCSLEGLMLKLKLQYFGLLMRRADSFEKTLMLGKIEGRRRRDGRG